MLLMIPRVYQPETPSGERAGEGFAPPAEAVARMMKFNEELARAGLLIDLDGLHPLAKGARVVFSRGKSVVTDGPSIRPKEVVGGFWILQAGSKREALEWARRCPAADGDILELRQVFEAEDFPAETRSAARSEVVASTIENRQA